MRWFCNFLSQPFYGKNLSNLARFPESKDIWQTIVDPAAPGGRGGGYITDWEYGGGATVNMIIGGVGTCQLIEPIIINNRIHCQITIYPLDGEWQRLITMLGSISMQPSLEFYSYNGAIVIGTKGVSVDSKQATSSHGKYSSSSWSPSKHKATGIQGKDDKKRWRSTMFGNTEVPIYDGTKLDEIRWDDVENLPCVSEDLDLDAIVLVAHTTSMYKENNVSLNVQFVVKLA
ncbi:hypothetical protein K439DRAFT_1617883 [Ramaria rubella]|nr:hypothetical protein K439DRAFT_1617883 [Ramaria rubella]